MKTYNIDFTGFELCRLRCLISAEMDRTSEVLDIVGKSSEPDDRKYFSYLQDKYQFLKSSYDRLCVDF